MEIAEKINMLCELLSASDAVIIGAGAGMSASAGLTYSGERFEKYFSDFREKYGITDMYSGGFYPFETAEEYWAWWSRNIYYNRYDIIPGKPYMKLLNLVDKKDYFVITTNVDHQFQLAGFDKLRLFYTQGDYGLFQCSKPCCQETFDNEQAVRTMLRSQENMRIPSRLIPVCPVCGRPMTTNLRIDENFVQDTGWHQAAERYSRFLQEHRKSKVLFLELGTGMNTPGIIKYPFWRMTHEWKNAFYVCLNLNEAYAPWEIANKSLCINGDIGEVLEKLQT